MTDTSSAARPAFAPSTRLATPADAPAIERLLELRRQEMGQPASPPETPGDAVARLQVLLAEAEGEMVGMLAVQRCASLLERRDFLLLSDIFVRPEYRQRGIARALMDACRELARELGCRRMSLIVPDVNLAALTTAARSGFTRHDELFLSWFDG